MNRESFVADIFRLPVFDTHTHLNIPGVPIAAQSIWDVAHYFWFLRELQAAGYPVQPDEHTEDARFTALVDAFAATRNTSWNWAVRRMARELYDVELQREEDFREFDFKVRQTSQDHSWPRKVIDKVGVKRITVNIDADVALPALDGVGCLLTAQPRMDIETAVAAIAKENITGAKLDEFLDRTVAEIESAIEGYAKAGIRGVRIDNSPYEGVDFAGYTHYLERPDTKRTGDVSAGNEVGAGFGNGTNEPVESCRRYLYDHFLRILESHRMLVQMFLGMKRSDIPIDTALNDTGRIVRLHPLFHRHPGVTFELVMGCELNNLDVVQAARMYRNVNPGGLWWFNFRTSTYAQALGYRFEALPAGRTAILATDARCIEWCFTKTTLVKQIVAEFLVDRIEKGWINQSDAIDVARSWLHDTAQDLYT